MTAKNILKKLGDELGHITIIADWIKKELALLEEIVGLKDNTLATAGALVGHGAGDPPGGVPVEAPAEGNAPANVQDGMETPAVGLPNVVQPIAEESALEEGDVTGEAPAAAADTAAAASDSGSALDANAASADAGEAVGDGNTAQTDTSAPLPDENAAAPVDAAPVDGGIDAT